MELKTSGIEFFEQQKLTSDSSVAWKSKPSWHIVATGAHTVHPELQRFLAKRMNAKITETPMSHVSMLSTPDLVAA